MSQAKWPTKRIVEVDWVDSAFCRGWQSTQSKKDDQGIVTCRSVGYLLDSDDTQIRLVGSQTPSSATDGSTVADGLSIPRVAVRRIRVIGRVK